MDSQPSSGTTPRDLDAEDLQDAGAGVSKAADREPGGAMKCAYCNIKFESGDQLEVFNGQLFHGFCVEDGMRLAIAAE